jgi:RND family efflux transporter MFP subunit
MTETEVHDDVNMTVAKPLQASVERTHSLRRWLFALVILAAAAGLLFFGIRSRINAEQKLRAVTAQMAVPSVTVVRPTPSTPAQEIILPGNVQPFISSPVYARVNGYLKKWYFDIGAHVKAGQLLAVIAAPEIDQQLATAQSNLATAQANLELAQITMTRYQGLSAKHAVSQQDVDNAVGTYRADQATVNADRATVGQYEAMVSFEKIYAPFDGVITARNTDIGDLINSGNTGNVKTDLFHIAQPGMLRVYVNVPQEYSRGVKPGETTADIVLAEFPGRKFAGKLVTTAQAINMTTRTLLTEIDLPNPAGTLLSGSYAEVHLKIPSEVPTYLIPVNALIFRSQGLQVGVVQGGKVALKTVMPGHDLGEQMEIVEGLNADDQVILNPPDSLVAGQAVHVVDAMLPGDVK